MAGDSDQSRSGGEPRDGFVLMRVGGLTLDPVTKTPIVVLKDEAENLNLPIWIGLLEATSMATELEGVKMARPMTHDLLRNMLTQFGAQVESIEVTELKENTFYAVIHLSINGQTVSIDSRPSDAISLALMHKHFYEYVNDLSAALDRMIEGLRQAPEGAGLLPEAVPLPSAQARSEKARFASAPQSPPTRHP